MSKYVKDGSAYAYKVSFMVDGELVVPDVDSVYLTVTNNAGTIIDYYDELQLAVPALATSYVEEFSGADNTSTLTYEFRHLEFRFTYQDKTYFIRDSYILRESLNFPLNEQDVRDLLGVSSSEAPDNAIDIFRAYDGVKLDAGEAVNLDTIISGGSILIPSVIEAVKYKAALALMISIQTSMFQMEQADNTIYNRFQNIDFAGIIDQLTKKYSSLLNVVLEIDTPEAPLLSTLAVGTDPVTNT